MQCSAEPIVRQPRRSSEPLAIAGALRPLAWVLGRWESIRESIGIEKRQRDAGMWPCDVVVVTNERSHLPRVAIPDACAAEGIPCVDMLGWFRMEGWTFSVTR